MNKYTLWLLLIWSTCLTSGLQGQNSMVDSLYKDYLDEEQDTTRIRLLLKIGAEFEHQDPDSALVYFFDALELAESLVSSIPSGKKSRKYHEKTALSLNAKTLRYIGTIQRGQSDYDKAMENYLKSVEIYNELGNKKALIVCYNDIGLVYKGQGRYNMAIENYVKSLNLAVETDYKNGMSMGYNNIGGVHWYMGTYDKAIENFEKALKIYEELGDKTGVSICYCNIGLVYMNQGNYDEALKYSSESLKIDKELNDEYGMSFGYNNMGVINENQGRYDEAIEYYFKSLKIGKKVNDKSGVSQLYNDIASSYIKKADTYKVSEPVLWRANLDSALIYANLAYDLAVEIDALHLQNTAAEHLQKIYTQLGQYRQALKFAEINISTYDTIFSEEKANAIAEMATKYEAENKQLQIEKMEQQKQLDDITIEAQTIENRRQQIIIIFTVAGFIISLAFIIIIFILFRQKRKANILLEAQNEEINKQKEKIEEQNRSITDSIIYAQRIQRALLPPGDYIKSLLPHRFVFYQPRDIVSGDFYWVTSKEDVVISVAADCTGHGVPGAMMSMLGVSILSEIINTIPDLDAAEILNIMRTKLIDSLHQGGKDSDMYDGIDLALCLIHLEKDYIQFAGANSPLYLIRDEKLKIIRGDKMPIGIHARMESFTNKTVKILPNDMLYIFSDGFADQFGGEYDKRFTQRRFQELLMSIHQKSMDDQRSILEKSLDEWKKDSNQIDDVLVLGVKM